MGAVIGRIHPAFAEPDLGLPAPGPRPAKVTDPEDARLETERFLELAAERREPDDFDRDDRSCDDLFFGEKRMIIWWTANLAAVEATFGA